MLFAKLKIVLIIVVVGIGAACRTFPFGLSANQSQTVSAESAATENADVRPPFVVREPERYRAELLFTSKLDETGEPLIRQTTVVARDGAARRLDFEFRAGESVSRLQTKEGKRFVVLRKEKVYAEIGESQDLIERHSGEDQNAEISLAHLLHAQPVGATLRRIKNEIVAGRETTLYQLDYGAVTTDSTATTVSFLWFDEKSGLPLKTQAIALVDGKPSGANSTMELQELQTDVSAETFVVPADYRRISLAEANKFLAPEN